MWLPVATPAGASKLLRGLHMALTVFLSSSLRKEVPSYDPVRGITLEAQPGSTVADVCRQLGIRAEAVKIIMVDGRARPSDYQLKGAERIGLFPPVGGG